MTTLSMSVRQSALFLVLVASLFSISAAAAEQRRLLIYCGITMVKPVTELARVFEARENVSIQIAQGGSEDLYQSAKKNRLGDIYFPGEPAYRDIHLSEGLLGNYRVVGYNQMAMMVQKGNPRHVEGQLRELLRKDLAVIIGNATSGSVGQESRRILEVEGIYPQVVANASELSPDSRSINLALKRGHADVALNWRATASFPDNAPYVDAIDLPVKIAEPKPLLMIELSFSKNPDDARKFIEFVASNEGQVTFSKYGFLDNRTLP